MDIIETIRQNSVVLTGVLIFFPLRFSTTEVFVAISLFFFHKRVYPFFSRRFLNILKKSFSTLTHFNFTGVLTFPRDL